MGFTGCQDLQLPLQTLPRSRPVTCRSQPESGQDSSAAAFASPSQECTDATLPLRYASHTAGSKALCRRPHGGGECPAGNGFADWKYLTLHFLRSHMDATYREIVDWASETDRVRGRLQLARSAFPAPSSLWRSFERVPTRVWRQLLRRSATRCDPGDHGAMDARFSIAKRHPATTSTRRIATYGR